MSKTRPTMKDVAELAEVSIQTVSAVVNNKPEITERTRERVLAAIETLGYRPYTIARSLRTRETRTIALVVSDVANPSFATMASAAEDYAHQFGYSLVLYNTHDDTDREANYLRSAVQRWVDGILFVSAGDRLTNINEIVKAGIPSVAIDRIPEHYTGPSVTLDNVRAGRLATEHLLELGHTAIAHISGPRKLRLVRERMSGYEQAMAQCGFRQESLGIDAGDWTCKSGYQAMQWLLKQHPNMTAVFAANDRMAIGAMRAIHDTGRRVPDDISVVGVDDLEEAAFQTPGLTTVRQSFAEIGTLGVKLLFSLLKDEAPDRTQIVIEPALIVRESTTSVA